MLGLRDPTSAKLPKRSRYLMKIETAAAAAHLVRPRARRAAVARWEVIMWRQEREHSLDALLDHPALGLAMKSMGMDRRAVELLLESAPPMREPELFANAVPG
jgi:hypothetical protein